MLKKATLRKIQINPCDQHQEKVSKLDENTKALRSQNTELFARINDLKKDLTNKSSLIDKIAKEKQPVERWNCQKRFSEQSLITTLSTWQ